MRKRANQESEIGVHKYEGYTMMQNHHLRNKGLSLKAVGLLSKILSLPPDWDYSLRGLATLNTDGILANCIDHMDIHHIIRQCIFPDDIPEYLRIKRFIHHTIESCAHFRVIAITHGFNQQVAQGFIIKRDFAKYIKNFSAEGLPLFLKF